MKIVHFIDYFQPKIGYQEFFLAKFQKIQGHDVTVVTSDRFFPFPNYQAIYAEVLGSRQRKPGRQKERGIDVIRLKSEWELKTVIWLEGLEKTLMHINPDLVYVHSIWGISALRVARLKSKSKFKLIFDCHEGLFNTNFQYDLRTRFYYNVVIQNLLKQAINSHVDQITAIGPAERDFVRQVYGISEDKIKIIRAGVDTKVFYPDPDARKVLRNKLEIRKREKVIIYTGKMSEEKDVDVLIEAFSNLDTNLKTQCRLILLGSANNIYKKHLKNLITEYGMHDRVIWKEMVGQKGLADFFRISDLAIWPGNPTISRYEAMACGVPVIIPDFNGTNEIVEKGGAINFERGNASDLCSKIQKILKNRVLLNKLSKKSLKIINSEYSWEKVAKNMTNVVKVG